ncbi:MAG: DUF1501 domain-containing protein [Planctomycetota bacterium]|nr:DUF1501 domain-containing protein [Planctomycetota bacterium]
MNPLHQYQLGLTRRTLIQRSGLGVGATALGTLINPSRLSATPRAAVEEPEALHGGLANLPHFAAKAKRVIYMFQSGAPSQVDLFDHKPTLESLDGTELPDSIRQGQRLTGMTSGQKQFLVTKSFSPFRQHGNSGMWLSDLLPHHAKIADDMCVIKSVHTEAINHDPAITFFQSGNQQPGRPCFGSWCSYGLGSDTADLPAFVVLLSECTDNQAQPLYSRLWGSGFLPSNHQGVKFRGDGEPVLYLKDPTGESVKNRREFLDTLAALNERQLQSSGDREIQTRMAAYEMAYRMQMSVPDLVDFSDEPERTFDLYGEDAKTPGTHAANCVLARRLAERGVRFIQLYHRGWDHHGNLPGRHPTQARETDQGSAGLILDLKERGLLEDTLVIWGGEFGRTVYAQGGRSAFGRDHHPRCFSMWLAGGGIQPGMSFGETDDFCYNVAKDPVHVHDLHATLLHCLGIDHERLTYRFQGRQYRLTDIAGEVVKPILI